MQEWKMQEQWWIEGWATGAAAQGTKLEGGTKERRAKITRICMTKNVIDFIILNSKSVFSSIALIAVIM